MADMARSLEQNTSSQTKPFAWVRQNAAFIVVGLIVIGALGVRLLTFERFLPFMDYTDETWYYGFAQQSRGLDEFYLDMTAHTAPPLQAFVSGRILALSDAVTNAPWSLPSVHIYWLRAWAVVMGTVTTAAIAWGGWQLGGPFAAGFAAFIWAFHPQIVNINSLAVSDPYMYMFVALTLATAIRAWKTESPWWLLASLVTGVCAIYAKYWIAAAVVPFSLTTLYLLWRNPRRMLPWIGVYAVLALGSTFYLLGVVNPLGNALGLREVDTFRNDGVRNAFDLSRITRNLRIALYPIARPLFYGGVLLGTVAYVYNRRQRNTTTDWKLLLMLLIFCILTLMNASTFTVARLEFGKLRHVLSPAIGFMLIWGTALSQVHIALADLTTKRPASLRYSALALLPLIVLGTHTPLFATQNTALALNYQKEHIAEVVWTWTDTSLPQEGLVWLENGSALATLWNRPWGGYDGNRPFEWWNEPPEDIARQSVDELTERNITHLIFTDDDLNVDMDVPGMTDLVDDMLLLKTIPAPDVFTWHGTLLEGVTKAYIYRVNGPQVASDITFGEAIQLVGYDLLSDAILPGDTVGLRLFWNAETTPERNYNLFLHLTAPDSDDIITQADGTPALSTRPTITWDDPDEILVSDRYVLAIPDDLAPGTYTLHIGLYDFMTGQRLLTEDEADKFTVTVEIR
jgi:4-amino-4-deoxy-L-arabinose transferase-like glycosyltransferase